MNHPAGGLGLCKPPIMVQGRTLDIFENHTFLDPKMTTTKFFEQINSLTLPIIEVHVVTLYSNCNHVYKLVNTSLGMLNWPTSI